MNALRKQALGQQNAEPAALATLAVDPQPVVRSLRILIIEDNVDAAESLRWLLEHYGHQVTVAYSGYAGVEAALACRPDVVLCDIGLPGMDGYGVVQELRRRPETARARMIAVTAYCQDSDRRRSLEAGFDLHLAKPVDPTTLEIILVRGEPH